MYSYDHSAASDAEDRVGQAASNLGQSVQELADKVRQLASNWEGDEFGAYQGVQSKVDNGSDAITQILSQIQTALGNNTQSVSGMQSQIQNTLTSG